MRTHPVFLRLEGRSCVIVGGDDAAAAKALQCLRAGGDVTIVAAELGPTLGPLVAGNGLRHVAREYRPGDLAGAFLVYASVRDPAVVGRLSAEAAHEHVLLNVIDTPDACTFLSPAVVERGDLRVAIGTGGASPGLAAELRRRIAAEVGPEYGGLVAILGAVRNALAVDPVRARERAEVMKRLLASPLLALVREGRGDEIDALLARVAGEGLTLERLGVRLEGQA
jgi:precorrin-2 dehydrogenase/sirohydrochlorin ferrochelatase